jgi:hypothetical protein
MLTSTMRTVARRSTLASSRALSQSAAPPSLILKGADARASLMEEVREKSYPDLVLTGRQLCDVELLLNGGFNPLDGFLNKADTESVYDNYRLTSGGTLKLKLKCSKFIHYTSCNYRKNVFLFVHSSFIVFSIITASNLT